VLEEHRTRPYTPRPLERPETPIRAGSAAGQATLHDAHPMPKKQLTPKELAEYQQRLRMLLGALTGDMDKLEQEALGDRTASLEANADGGTDSYFQEFSLELLERDESTVREVLQALERIKSGNYGTCESCSEGILKERLRLVPHARNCIECQRKEDQASL
jgi:DnaK suppressor protein